MKTLFKKISMLGLGILVGAFALNFSACKSEEQKRMELLEQERIKEKEMEKKLKEEHDELTKQINKRVEEKIKEDFKQNK